MLARHVSIDAVLAQPHPRVVVREAVARAAHLALVFRIPRIEPLCGARGLHHHKQVLTLFLGQVVRIQLIIPPLIDGQMINLIALGHNDVINPLLNCHAT